MICGKEQIGPRVTAVEPADDHMLILEFDNGERRLFDVRPLLDVPVYRNLLGVFSEARVEFGTVVWPGDIDISPDTLYSGSVIIE